MGSYLFTNVRILDGSGAAAYPGEVLVQGNRISRVSAQRPGRAHDALQRRGRRSTPPAPR